MAVEAVGSSSSARVPHPCEARCWNSPSDPSLLGMGPRSFNPDSVYAVINAMRAASADPPDRSSEAPTISSALADWAGDNPATVPTVTQPPPTAAGMLEAPPVPAAVVPPVMTTRPTTSAAAATATIPAIIFSTIDGLPTSAGLTKAPSGCQSPGRPRASPGWPRAGRRCRCHQGATARRRFELLRLQVPESTDEPAHGGGGGPPPRGRPPRGR